MNDKELLELAAKAAGYKVIPRDGGGWFDIENENSITEWNPLVDDGQAFRLAVDLGLVIDCSRPSAGRPFVLHHFLQEDFVDRKAATRSAIVRAAAEIRRSKT